MNDKRHVPKGVLRRRFGLALLPLLTTGCLFVGGTQRTDFEEAERLPVRFASARGVP